MQSVNLHNPDDFIHLQDRLCVNDKHGQGVGRLLRVRLLMKLLVSISNKVTIIIYLLQSCCMSYQLTLFI